MAPTVDVTHEPEQMPAPDAVERLLAAALRPLASGAAAPLARTAARMYSWARAIPGAATVSTYRRRELVGFGYGYSWRWALMTDAWSARLCEELGASADILEDSFSVVLVVVSPDQRRGGLGAGLLHALARQADEALTWLQTEADSPLRALTEASGWRPLDDGADPVIMLSG